MGHHDRFALIVMGFFVSHVPPARFDELWMRLRTWLRPGGCVWLVDERWRPGFLVVRSGPRDAFFRPYAEFVDF